MAETKTVKKEEEVDKEAITLFGQVVKIQNELQPIKKKESTSYKNKAKTMTTEFEWYNIDQQLVALKPLLKKHGVFTRFVTIFDGEENVLSMRVSLIEDEGFEESTMKIPGVLPQDIGSAITYYKRYMLSAYFLFIGEKDDDGKAAQESKNETVQKTVVDVKAVKSKMDETKNREELTKLWNTLSVQEQNNEEVKAYSILVAESLDQES